MVFEQFHHQYLPAKGFSQQLEDLEPEGSGLNATGADSWKRPDQW